MKRIATYILITQLVTGIAISWMAHNYYAPASLQKPFLINAQEDDTLRIAYIGDSWAFMHREHHCLIPEILEDSTHRPVRVHSYGICGLTSREIYENMHNNQDFKDFLTKRRYAYCFVSAGINDSYKKMSTAYYKAGMEGIIQLLLANDIRPIILEIPDYDIQKSYDRQTQGRKILRRLSSLVNHTPMDCKQQFRHALDDLIQEKGYTGKVGIVRYQSWNAHYIKDQAELYQDDGLHLNGHGYEVLDSAIVSAM